MQTFNVWIVLVLVYIYSFPLLFRASPDKIYYQKAHVMQKIDVPIACAWPRLHMTWCDIKHILTHSYSIISLPDATSCDKNV